MPRVLILYHYFPPDDVVSAQHLGDLAAGLARRGWEVVAMPCNRGCRDESVVYAKEEIWEGVRIRRVWRPRFKQSSNLVRIANAAWMIAVWSGEALHFDEQYDAVIVGTDPVFSVLAAIPWKLLRPETKILHWCFDLHPEAAEAEGFVNPDSFALRALKRSLKAAYAACDALVDIGACMARRLALYGSDAATACLTPWALVEPASPLPVDAAERAAVAPDAALCLMYSGNFGRAHRYERIVALAETLRDEPIRFVFSVRGNRVAQLREAAGRADANIAFVDFAAQDKLAERLSAADIHMVSLEDGWTGTVVPSKFFGSLAVGRPVLYEGRRDSAVGQWIERHGVGWVLEDGNIPETAALLRTLAKNPGELEKLRGLCHRAYAEHFSRERVIDGWDALLRDLTGQRLAPQAGQHPAPAGESH